MCGSSAGSRSPNQWRCRARCAVVVRVALPLILLVGASPVGAMNQLVESWHDVQQAAALADPNAMAESLETLESVSAEFGLVRVTPFAQALADRASAADPELAEQMLRGAMRLDPNLPSPRFLAGRLAWSEGQYLASAKHAVVGWFNVLRHEPTRRATMLSLVPWILLTLGVSAAVVVLLQTLHTSRRIIFDAYQLGLKVFGRSNALVFAVVVVLLPLFAGLGPVWLIVYLFAMSWTYLERAQRWWPPVALVVLLAVTPVFELWTRILATPQGLASRVESMLELRQADFGALQEFVGLDDRFASSEAYHAVAGELYRMHGDRDAARVQFEKALVASDRSLVPRLALAALALEDGNVSFAIQRLNEVVEINQNVALAHFNLATAYDQIRRFEEGDVARNRARDLGGADLNGLAVAGRERRIAFPKLDGAWVDQVVEDAPEDLRPLLSGGIGGLVSWRRLAAPLSWAAAFGLVFGAVVLALRAKWLPPGRQCTKCGKMFGLKEGMGDSTVYCSQCVSVFLKRDVVSIEQQTAKMRQVHRWNLQARWWRHVVSAVVPGGYHLLTGRGGFALAWTAVVWLPLVGALIWARLYLSHALPAAPVGVVEVGLLVLGVGMWLASAVSFSGRR